LQLTTNPLVPRLPDSTIRPVIKWTGGKFDEFPLFAKYVPPFTNYYEPFFGGGGVFFALQPAYTSFLNDKSSDLARFYEQLQQPAFENQLLLYADGWEAAGRLAVAAISQLQQPFASFISDIISASDLIGLIDAVVDEIKNNGYQPLFEKKLVQEVPLFTKALKASLYDKCRRIKNICKKEDRLFSITELGHHIETGIKSGLYLHLRSILNQQASGARSLSPAKASANWYFVREFCYASMFRFNRKNEFNIPYGGIAYNRKNFRQKVQNIFKPVITSLFQRSTFYNLDFEQFLLNTTPRKGDFIFLDPPYDSEFSEYDQNAFTKADQQRLRDCLVKQKAKWMLVIKETDFIRDLYTSKGIHIVEFDKTYTYNVRGRNNRDTKHLIILNYLP